MAWLRELLTDEHSVATSILGLALTIGLGYVIGGIRIGSIRFGVAGVLFAGLLIGHFGFHLQPETAEFAREFGLVLFIYTVGMAVGPGFFNLFRAYGLRTNISAVTTVLLGTLLAWLSVVVAGVSPAISVGILAGATTNTPSLAAATQMLDDQPLEPAAVEMALRQIGVDGATLGPKAAKDEVEKLPGLGYAVTYPAGVVGIIASFLILRRLFGIDPVADARRMESEVLPPKAALVRRAARMLKAELVGKSLDQLVRDSGTSVVVSRVHRDNQTLVGLGTTVVARQDVLSIVGTSADVDKFTSHVGEPTDLAEFADSAEIVARWIVISRGDLVGRTIDGARMLERFHVRLTRVRRGETELLSFADLRLAFGDQLFAVGHADDVAALAAEAGDVAREVEEPHLLPMIVGIAIGVVLGSMPIVIPGLAAPLKIGLAGGPLIVALVLAHVRRVGRLVFYLPRPANTVLKELGIAMFLAVVGIKSGGRFVDTLTQGDGVWWLLWGIAVTLVPVLVVGTVSIGLFRAPYTAVIGVLAGSMTDPPALAFANSMTKSESASLTYATVYPTAMILRVICSQVFLIVSR
jgi:putative transport protein